MFVDASVITAAMLREPGSDALLLRLKGSLHRSTSPVAVWETTVAITRVLDMAVTASRVQVHDYPKLAAIEILPITAEIGDLALDAFDRYGKGRHPARLNMGDCFAYACARHYRQPLLYKGDDFALTDIETA